MLDTCVTVTARSVMSSPAIAVGPGTGLAQVIALMTRHKISGLPVVDANGRLVGMLTEGDLMRRVEVGTEGGKPGWFNGLFRPGAVAADYVHTHGRRVEEIMTPEVFTIDEDTPLTEVVAIMIKHRVKRLPVLRAGQLVGVVSRADLVAHIGKALAAAKTVGLNDKEILGSIEKAIQQEPWSPGHLADVSVHDGVVQLDGCLFDIRTRGALQVLAENIPGVKRVENNLVCIEPQLGMITFDPALEAQSR